MFNVGDKVKLRKGVTLRSCEAGVVYVVSETINIPATVRSKRHASNTQNLNLEGVDPASGRNVGLFSGHFEKA